MEKEKVIKLIMGNEYYGVEDLRYNLKKGILLSKDEFNDLLIAKDGLIDEKNEYITRLPLKTFNSKYCFYVNGGYLLSVLKDYYRVIISDFEINKSFIFERNYEDIVISRLFSEVEGSLAIENIPTTHKKIAEIHKNENVTDKNDLVIKNMLKAVHFIIKERPEFNKENLFKLYTILSKDSLPEESRLREGEYYRHDKVFVGGYEGAPYHAIGEYMDSLFEFAGDEDNVKRYSYLFPFICHYYVLYVHPYFDYNGRTARMVSFWLNYIHNIKGAPYFMSEAINECKGDYYRALVNTRETRNDLTYFLGYILETSVRFSLVYKNLEVIKEKLLKSGDSLSSAELVYVKKIIIHSPEDYFNYKMFLKYINGEMTRQGALKILNNLTDYEVLLKSKNKKGGIIYKLNPEFLTYKYN